MKKKEDKEEWDDGRTIAPMTGEELPEYRRALYNGRENKRTLKGAKSDLSRKERRAMIRAMFAVMLPRLLVIVAAFAVTGLLIWLWLS